MGDSPPNGSRMGDENTVGAGLPLQASPSTPANTSSGPAADTSTGPALPEDAGSHPPALFDLGALGSWKLAGTASSSPDPQTSPIPGLPSSVPALPSSVPGQSCAFLLDVAGQDETMVNPLHTSATGLGNPGRDSTALTIVEIDLSTLATLEHPTYHVVARHSWVGENHLSIFGKLKSLADTWHPQHIVIDATGVGEGLWGMLDRHFPSRLIPVKFTQQEKSEIGWQFLSIIETGRFRDHCHTGLVHLQYTHCIYEILPGPAKTLRWGVPEGARGPDGSLLHDDFVLADSLVAKLDGLEWYLQTMTAVVELALSPLEAGKLRF